MGTTGSLLTEVSIAGPWPRCEGRSINEENGAQSCGSSSLRATRIRLSLGTRTSSGSFTYSMCVQWFQLGIRELSNHFQTELAIDTNIRVADTQVTVTNTQVMVADTRTTVADTRTMVADMHRNMLTGQKDASGKTNSVSASYYP
jgi:hypothetical protein